MVIKISPAGYSYTELPELTAIAWEPNGGLQVRADSYIPTGDSRWPNGHMLATIWRDDGDRGRAIGEVVELGVVELARVGRSGT